jgi:hypothetical protein
MRTWLLTWSPGEPVGWKTFARDYNRVRAGRTLDSDWSVQNNKSIAAGDRLFLLRQRVEPKGIIASAVATGAPFTAKKWNGEKGTTNYVLLTFDAIVDAASEPILLLDQLQQGALGNVNWNTRRGGIGIRPDAAIQLERRWYQHLRELRRGILSVPVSTSLDDNYPDEAFEGVLGKRFVTHRSRERLLRASKVRQVLATEGRLACEVRGCGFDYAAVYGALGQDYAHVHHKNPLSDSVKPTLTRLEDLAIVCANCHAMIHRGGECRTLREVMPRKRPRTMRSNVGR